MNSFGDIDYASSIEAIIQQCRFLDFTDQLKIASDCVLLNNILKNHIWKEKYQTLNIFEKSREFVVKNETTENGICLNAHEIQEFQRQYADKVHKLSIKNIELHLENNEDLTDVLHGRMLRKNILNIRQFKNLKSLTYRYMAIPKDHVRRIAEINPNLEELRLVNCSLEISMDQLLNDVVLQMKNLKSLIIANFQRFTLKYCRFQEILTMAKLERLQLTAVIEPDEYVASSNEQILAPLGNLKGLNIELTTDSLKWPNNLAGYFKTLETLSSLAIETVDTLNDNTLAVIAQVCPNLETLSIRSTDFGNIERFPVASKLTTLSLIGCRGLSCDNLRHILTQLKVNTFHSKQTIYEGVFEGSRVSACIRNLRIDGINTQKLTFPHRNNNVEHLTFHNPGSNNETSFSAKSLAWCTRLKSLDIQNGYLPLKILMLLKSLSSLEIPSPSITYNWSYITGLLKHPSLKQLSLRNYTNGCSTFDLDVPTEGVSTNITSLYISLDVFEVALDFWLDLWSKSENLHQISCSYDPDDKYDIFLAKLVYHPSFPESAIYIDINGFRIRSNELKWNFMATMNKLREQMDKEKCWYDNDQCRIVLLR